VKTVKGHSAQMIAMPLLHLQETKIDCELVMFDMTGTLIDVQPRIRARAAMRAKVMAERVGDEAVREWARLSGVELESWETDEDGPLVKAPRREDLIVGAAAIYVAGYRWDEAKDLVERVYDEADRMLSSVYEPSLFEGVEGALRALRAAGFKLAIATNDRRAEAEKTLRVIGVLDLFEAVVGADEVDDPKPSPAMVLLACERCGATPLKTVYVGDQPTDMEAGRRAGAVATVLVKTSPTPGLVELADHEIESVSELRSA